MLAIIALIVLVLAVANWIVAALPSRVTYTLVVVGVVLFVAFFLKRGKKPPASGSGVGGSMLGQVTPGGGLEG